MKVTSVVVNPSTSGKISAFVDITFDDVLTVKGLKLINGAKGMFLAMPAQKKDEQWIDQVLMGAELRTAAQTAAISAYNEHSKSSSGARPNRNNPGKARLSNDLDDLGAPPLG